MADTQTIILRDVAIIGAGPCGLAVAARLREATPSALFTDVEHQRLHWLRRNKHHHILVKTKGHAHNMVLTGDSESHKPRYNINPASPQYDVQVFDSTADTWMAKWKGLFRGLEIHTLRSPLFFHPDPSDRDGLKAFAFARGREDEMMQLKGVVGKELSRHQKKKLVKRHRPQNAPRGIQIDAREMQDYYTPSAHLFDDYCEECVNRYGLFDSIQHTNVKSVIFHESGTSSISEQCFKIETLDGDYWARTVVLAVGGGPPQPMPTLVDNGVGASHSSEFLKKRELPLRLKSKIAQKMTTNVIVIGGGLTSAQISSFCIRKGVTKVWHIMRSDLKIKHFDLDLNWVAKYKNIQMSAFWLADTDQERIQMIQEARNGGSITPAYHKVLLRYIKQGSLNMFTKTLVTSQTFDESSKTWKLTTEPPIQNLPQIDHIYYATGSNSDVTQLPVLDSLLNSHPIPIINGLPCLTDDMQWREDVPLFIAGRFAALRLGPGAGNLEGARSGAERIAWGLQNLLQQNNYAEPHKCFTEEQMIAVDKVNNLREGYKYGPTHLNMYNALEDDDGEN